MKNRIFFKLLAAFLIAVATTAITLDYVLGSAWEHSLRAEIESGRSELFSFVRQQNSRASVDVLNLWNEIQ